MRSSGEISTDGNFTSGSTGKWGLLGKCNFTSGSTGKWGLLGKTGQP